MSGIEKLRKIDIIIQIEYYSEYPYPNVAPLDELKKMKKKELINIYNSISHRKSKITGNMAEIYADIRKEKEKKGE